MVDPAAQEILSFWFGPLDEAGCAGAEASARWWRKSPEFDREIGARFGARYEAASEGRLDGWLDEPGGRLAQILLLDQFSRNMFRDTGKMYAQDARALGLALDGLTQGCEAHLGFHGRQFLYMPLMHAEDVGHQRRCVALFESLKADYPGLSERADGAIDFAVQHRDIVERFGRFPHRNRLLGRQSTAEEEAFLAQPGSSF